MNSPAARRSEQFRFLSKRWPVLLFDALLIAAAWLLAYWFRFNLQEVPADLLAAAVRYAPIVVVVHLVCGVLFGVHRTAWQFVSAPDLGRLFKATMVAMVVVTGVLFVVDRMAHIPRSVLILHGLLAILLLGGARLVYRLVRDQGDGPASGRRVLLVGGGKAGEMLVRDMRRGAKGRDSGAGQVVGIVDDDPSRHGRDIQGVRVYGAVQDLPRLVEELDAERIVIAIPSASVSEMRRLVTISEQSGVPYRTLPMVRDVVDGVVDSSDVKKVEIEDLLGRDPVALDWDAIGRGVSGKRVLVTGAGGSIGAELCRQLSSLGVASLTLFERNEFNLYSIQSEFERANSSVSNIGAMSQGKMSYVLGDVCDPVAVEHLFATHQPEIVFHAAAYKHVPLLEEQVRESVRNNILGTRMIADAAHGAGCERFVLISTDKAVNPSSCMGASKRVAEIYCRALSRESRTRFITVRFGNVLGSAGSVVPLFRSQIEDGGPVTVTHQDMTRYFMTIAEACQLILQATSVGEGGEIFVLDMGEPISITYLAEQMIRLSGKEPGRDIEISYTGLRPGEKLSEKLFHDDEPVVATGYPKLMLARSREADSDKVTPVIDVMSGAVDRFDAAALGGAIRELVPEYRESP